MNLDLAGFALLAGILTISPGQDTALVLRNASRGGFAAGIATTAGVCAGLFFHATLSALGLAAILATSPAVFAAVQLVGAAYLIWLGVQSILRVWRRRAEAFGAGDARGMRASVGIREGLLSNLLNPNTALFYLALLPQFAVFPERVLADSLILAGVHFVMSFAWLALLSALVDRAQRLLARPRVWQALDFVAGSALVALGLRLALERR